MQNSKKRAAATAAAVALGALLVLGGASMAWLQDSTKVTTNEFATNSNSVKLNESNTSFDIVPGTSEVKDPVVSASYTLDSYVYVVVYDNTQGLVEWEMDSSWVQLTDADGEQVTTDDGGLVYYQLLTYEGDGTAASFSDTVIAGSTVSYSSSLTNEDMEDVEDVTLAFQAYIIQAQFSNSGNATPLLAWLYLTLGDDEGNLPDGYTVNENTGEIYTSFADAVSDASTNATLQLLADADETSMTVSKSVTIDLNGNTLDIEKDTDSNTAGIFLNTASATLTIEDTSEDGSGVIASSTYTDTVFAMNGTVVFKSGTISNTRTSGYAVYVMTNATFIMSGEDAVIDCENAGGYCVYANTGSTFEISAGTIKNAKSNCIYMNGTAKGTISGGTISTTTGNCIYIQGTATLDIKNDPQIINSYTSGYCLRVASTNCTVNVAGGTFTADGGYGGTVYVSTVSYAAAMNITGGTFNPILSENYQTAIT